MNRKWGHVVWQDFNLKGCLSRDSRMKGFWQAFICLDHACVFVEVNAGHVFNFESIL